jgi:hypothetical protein
MVTVPAAALYELLYPPAIYKKCGHCGYDRSAIAHMAPCPECGRYAYAPGTPSPEELKALRARRERHLVWGLWLLFWVCVALTLVILVLR